MRLLAVACLVLASMPLKAENYKTYVKVPYAATVDELLFAEIVAGRHKEFLEGRELRVSGDKIERAVGPAGEKKWRVVGELPLFASDLLGFDKAIYNSNGYYLLATDVFDKIKDKLIAKHQGRLEMFLSNAGLKEQGFPDTTNPELWVAFVWDADSACWRWPQTLRRVEAGYKLPDGTLLSGKHQDAALKKSEIEGLAERWAADQAKARKK